MVTEFSDVLINFKTLFPKQRKALSFAFGGRGRTVLLSGGIQSGKTFTGARFAVLQVLRCQTPSLSWIASPTFPMSKIPEREIFSTGIERLLHSRNLEERTFKFKTPKGFYTLEFRSGENPDRLRGPALGSIWIDEGSLLSEEAYKILYGRLLVSGGPIFITTTPKYGRKSWIYKRIIEPWQNGSPKHLMVEIETKENIYLDPDQVEQTYKEYEGKWKEQELLGKWVDIEGAFFEGFHKARHVLPDVKIENTDEFFGGVDFGFTHPTAHLWVIRRGEQFIVLDEYYESGKTTEEHTASILVYPHDARVLQRFGDPSGAQEMCDWARRHVYIIPGNRDRKYGWRRIKALLASDKLKITARCVRLISEMESVEGDGGGEDLKSGQSDHALDALRYVISSLPFPYTEEKKESKYVNLDHSSRSVWESIDEMDKPKREDVWDL